MRSGKVAARGFPAARPVILGAFLVLLLAAFCGGCIGKDSNCNNSCATDEDCVLNFRCEEGCCVKDCLFDSDCPWCWDHSPSDCVGSPTCDPDTNECRCEQTYPADGGPLDGGAPDGGCS